MQPPTHWRTVQLRKFNIIARVGQELLAQELDLSLIQFSLLKEDEWVQLPLCLAEFLVEV